MVKTLNLIFVSQEYSVANHQGLWQSLASNPSDIGDITVVVNIAADFVVSVFKRRFYRIREAFENRVQKVGDCFLVRPLFFLRTELAGQVVNRANMEVLKKLLVGVVPDIESREIRALFYDGNWARLINSMFPRAKLFYYIVDEVTRTAADDSRHEGRSANDRSGCEYADRIFVTSSALSTARPAYREKIVVVGNGGTAPQSESSLSERDPDSVGLVGNIRDWIDKQLLENLISLRPDLQFTFVGNIEDNMRVYVERIIQENSNVRYAGMVRKDEVWDWYRSFRAVIVPYKQNEFIRASRPIKIVESVLAGTPVVTVPVDGYKESEFILFARTAEGFSTALDSFPRNGIDLESPAYAQFTCENSWSAIAKRILEEFAKTSKK